MEKEGRKSERRELADVTTRGSGIDRAEKIRTEELVDVHRPFRLYRTRLSPPPPLVSSLRSSEISKIISRFLGEKLNYDVSSTRDTIEWKRSRVSLFLLFLFYSLTRNRAG